MKVLVAGIGNMFLGDDGWGCAMATALRARTWPPGVEVIDYGIRGMDLAYKLTSGIDAAILIDAVARGGAPGTLYVIEPSLEGDPAIDNHAMTPAAVLRLASQLGALPPYLRVVGCEPARLDDDGDIAPGLSAAIECTIPEASEMVVRLVEDLVT